MVLSDDEKLSRVQIILKPLDLSTDDYKTVFFALLTAMIRGLQLQTREQSSVKMFPSFVTRFPTGKGNAINLTLSNNL